LTLRLPLNCLTGISGVSGSGKSSLLLDYLYPRLQKYISYNKLPEESNIFFIDDQKRLSFLPFLNIYMVDQKPVSHSKRSTAISYINGWDLIRKVFASCKDAAARGLSPGHFSFNSSKGRCPGCMGKGFKEIEMHFISDVTVKCDECNGQQYNRQVLNIFYKGKNISQVLNMSFNQAYGFFSGYHKIQQKLKFIIDSGLGYLKLGNSTAVLSGGELQRLKLAKELSRRNESGGNLYILDEPTTGLHYQDISALMDILQRLVTQGNTVAVIEHNKKFLKNCDYLIDMGPEGGYNGGKIVAAGTPARLKKQKQGYTWRYL
ncbi:MAG TPA: excinuclease ABC subunit UvrA, partial [Spirochaetota bacterium]|nr:excinuclease ABC subunit UvrA [Spirochaetota bacterium]